MKLNIQNQRRAIEARLDEMYVAAEEGDLAGMYKLTDELECLLMDLRLHIVTSIDCIQLD